MSDPIMDQHGDGEWLLEVDGLTVDYGLAKAVDNLSLRVAPGAIVAIVGANGAGKTTTLSALMGLLPATGSVRFRGRQMVDCDVVTRVVKRLALVPETRDLFVEMSVEENLRLGAFQRYLNGDRDFDEDFARVHALFPRLKERSRQLAGTLSGGERQMLAIGRALMARPLLLMLDEPSLGLAPLVVGEIISVIAKLRRDGVSVLLVEQNAKAALGVADYAYAIEAGRVAFHGPAAQLASDPRIVEVYLGSAETTRDPDRDQAADFTREQQKGIQAR
ncbi:ABC transporter ATP-binding protein [Bradyrhizobium liaoningense]|uniref:ABC transporter ATP-binding protein n=1 Tax=Bradyrhizobium liaoningense TaxID=43992 RepID=UPI0032DEB5B4